ncbi:MAG TPA: 23S rRNA (guanosine(2251)-2'-O)-methyltransferase RlmB [Candidatus Izemoplasmatales bacterium]|nr:23S rRNA (guanosine(2251)-2'-O)-methyltransferase RlmB [Candidatus Izemoplasmatales bacterium]
MSLLIYGRNTCLEVLKTDRQIFKGFVMEKTNQDILQQLKRHHIPVEVLSKHEFKKRFLGNHQGAVLDVEDYQTLDLQPYIESLDLKKNPFILMLDQITDVHNLGAIIRSCDAGGVDAIIIPKHRSAKINGTVAKTSSGAIEHVNIIEVTNLTNTLGYLKGKGFWTVGTDLSADKSYQEIIIDTPLCLVIGSEGKGISKNVKNHVDYNVKIDMVGQINSLNASVSAGILIFDILRRKLNE